MSPQQQAECMFCAVDLHGHGDGTCGCQECAEFYALDLIRNEHADEAIQAVALRVITDLAESHIEDEWENYPEIGEHDWRAVQDRVLYIAGQLKPEEGAYLDGYQLLAGRAEHTA